MTRQRGMSALFCRAAPRRRGTVLQSPARTPGRWRRHGPQDSAAGQTAPAIAGRAPRPKAERTTPAPAHPVGHAPADQRRGHRKAKARGLDAIVVAQHRQQRRQTDHIQAGPIMSGHVRQRQRRMRIHPAHSARPMMQPASSTPPMQARTLDLKSMSSRLAASVPVHAPVPGSGCRQTAAAPKADRGRPWPSASRRPCGPSKAEGEKLAPMTGLSAPHSSTLRAKKKMNGTGIMLPMMAMMYTCHSGRPSPRRRGSRRAAQ